MHLFGFRLVVLGRNVFLIDRTNSGSVPTPARKWGVGICATSNHALSAAFRNKRTFANPDCQQHSNVCAIHTAMAVTSAEDYEHEFCFSQVLRSDVSNRDVAVFLELMCIPTCAALTELPFSCTRAQSFQVLLQAAVSTKRCCVFLSFAPFEISRCSSDAFLQLP